MKEQEKCKTTMGLFEVLRKYLTPQHNKIVLSLKYCQLITKQSKNTEEWTDHLKIQANELEYKVKERRPKEHYLWHK